MVKNGGPKKKPLTETKGGKYIKYNTSNCTKTIVDIKTDKTTKVKMSREECASKGGNEKPIPKRTPTQLSQRNQFTARAQRLKREQEGNKGM